MGRPYGHCQACCFSEKFRFGAGCCVLLWACVHRFLKLKRLRLAKSRREATESDDIFRRGIGACFNLSAGSRKVVIMCFFVFCLFGL